MPAGGRAPGQLQEAQGLPPPSLAGSGGHSGPAVGRVREPQCGADRGGQPGEAEAVSPPCWPLRRVLHSGSSSSLHHNFGYWPPSHPTWALLLLRVGRTMPHSFFSPNDKNTNDLLCAWCCHEVFYSWHLVFAPTLPPFCS